MIARYVPHSAAYRSPLHLAEEGQLNSGSAANEAQQETGGFRFSSSKKVMDDARVRGGINNRVAGEWVHGAWQGRGVHAEWQRVRG